MGGGRRVGAASRHRLHLRLEVLLRLAEHGVEEEVQDLDQRVVGAERLAQRADRPRRLDLPVQAGEAPYVAAAEAVDRLLHVSDEESLWPVRVNAVALGE